jgi:hypothetical protein
MRINDVDILITKIEPKKTKEGADYISISFLDLSSGDNFNIISKNIEYMRLKQMTKYKCNLDLSSNKYGLKLDFAEVGKELGNI